MIRKVGFGILNAAFFFDLTQSLAFAIDSEVGEKHFNQYCSACHGLNAAGAGPATPALSKEPPDLRHIAKRRGGAFPAGEIAAYIDGRTVVSAHGSRDMPIWGEQFSAKAGGGNLGDEFARGKVDVLVDYLKSIQEH